MAFVHVYMYVCVCVCVCIHVYMCVHAIHSCSLSLSLSLSSAQVFHVPLEERRYQFEEVSFGGETRQSEIVRDIQEKTGCDIEMTQVHLYVYPMTSGVGSWSVYTVISEQ